MMNGLFRSALFFFLVFAGTGVSLPFIALWFRDRGLNGAEISVVLAAPMLARLLMGPLIAVWGDSFRFRRTPMAVLCAVASLCFALMGVVDGLAAWLSLWFVGATAIASVVPLADVVTMRLARREGFAFAVSRSAGSIAFIGASVAMGALLTAVKADVIVVWISVAAAFAALAAVVVLPPEPVHEAGERTRAADRFVGLGRLLGDKAFMVAIASIGVTLSAHAFNYGFSTLVWRGQGISEGAIGLLWAIGVVAEVAFMWWLEPLRARWGPWMMLCVGAAAAAVRWTALAFAPPLWLLWPLQCLHALTFAAVFLAGLQIVERLSPPSSLSVAQTLSSALSSGVLLGLATVFSGPLYDRYGAGGYFAMSVLAVLGLAGAFALRPMLAPRPAGKG